MDLYKEEMFKFLTQRDNYSNMLKIVGQYNEIRERLISEFWNLVFQMLQKKEGEIDKKWVITISEDIFNSKSRIMIFKKSWINEGENLPSICMAFERLTNSYPFYGLWINEESKIMDLDRMKEDIRNMDMYDICKNKADWWPFWLPAPINFNVQEDIKKILPDARNDLAEEFADYLFSFATGYEQELDELATMKI